MTIVPQNPQPPMQPSIHGKEPRGLMGVPHSPFYEGRFGRMFRKLPSLTRHSDQELIELAETMVEDPDAPEDNDEIPSGYTYLGQFIDHDITFDPTSKLQRDNDPDALRNFRTPRFDLDSLYGAGPQDSPFMYQPGGVRLLTGRTGDQEEDCPRVGPVLEGGTPVQVRLSRRAVIGDPRNDENIIIGQLHLAFIRYHNAVVDDLAATGLRGEELFDDARRIVRWHYQWMVIHDFLARLVHPDLVKDLTRPETYRVYVPKKTRGDLAKAELSRSNLRFFRWENQPYIPVEFSVGAYRFGHSQVRATYRLNGRTPAIPIFLIQQGSEEFNEFSDLRGFRERPSFWEIAWERFFPVGEEATHLQPSRLIDTRLAAGLHTLPFAPDIPSLAARNLLRGKALGLPSGQTIARAMGLPAQFILSREDMELTAGLAARFGDETPLWYYILREAAVHTGGERLGAVGGRIVAEVLVGLLYGDPHAYVHHYERWQPRKEEFGASANGTFTMSDLLRHAKVKLTG